MWPTRSLLRIYDTVTRRNISNNYRELCKKEYFSLSGIKGFQKEKLCDLRKYVRNNVPFYCFNMTNCLENIDDILYCFEVMTKELIDQNFKSLISDQYLNSKRLCVDYTGGSTGKPLKFAYNSEFKDFRWAMIYHNLKMAGYKLGDCHGFVYGSHFDVKKQYSLRQKLQNFMMNAFQVNAFFLNQKALERFVKICKRRKPKFLIGYATAMDHFADFVENNNISLSFDFLESTSEVLTGVMREKFRRVFGAVTFDRYGCREVGNIAHECTAHDGMHINWQSVYVEIINKGKYPWLGEDYGDIVVTSLCNIGMPLIRYDIGDIGRIDESPCRCGLAGQRLFLGGSRVGDLLCATDGSYVSPPALTLVYKDLEVISGIQFEQTALDFLKVSIVKKVDFSNKTEKILTDRLFKIFRKNMKIEILFIDYIKKEKSGKYRLTKRSF